MSARRPSTLPLTLAELVRIEPLCAASRTQLADPARRVEQVILAETFDRLRASAPHALIVLHAEAATGGWSLAAALHLAWERNAAAVVVADRVVSAAGMALAQRLNMSMLAINTDPVDVALQLAGQVSAPAAARALRQAVCAERLAEQTSLRGVLGVLNAELGAVPVALAAGDTLVAGRASALVSKPDTERVAVEITEAGERPWASLVAAIPTRTPALRSQVEALLRLARPALLAAWAHLRLHSSLHAAREQAAFGLLRRLATGPAEQLAEPERDTEVDAPPWSSELGWQVDNLNRAFWLAPLRASGHAPAELTHLLRAAWQRSRPTWPLIAEGDGWISWHSGDAAGEVAVARRALREFRGTAAAHQLVVGVGASHPGVTGLMRSVAEARLAAHIARRAGPAGVQWFDQVGPSAALAFLPVGEIAQVADLCLADLMGAKDRAALVDTVLAVLDCGGSLSQASARLGVHRNTVLGRLARARQFGLHLDEPSDRLAVHVLCYALASLAEAAPQASR